MSLLTFSTSQWPKMFSSSCSWKARHHLSSVIPMTHLAASTVVTVSRHILLFQTRMFPCRCLDNTTSLDLSTNDSFQVEILI